MKYHSYYLYTAIALSALYIVMAIIAAPFFTRISIQNSLANDIEAAKQEAHIIATMISKQPTTQKEKANLIQTIKTSIEYTNTKNVFNSVFDWSGRFISHPDHNKINELAPHATELMAGDNKINEEELYKIIFKKADSLSSEIIHLLPVKNSDMIVASHINKQRVIEQANSLRNKVYIIFLIIGLVTLIFFLTTIRIISNYYEKKLELKNTKLEDGVLNLSKLNASLENYQKNLSDFKLEREEEQRKEEEQATNTSFITEEEKAPKTATKQRILTYVRNELLPVATEDISYIYVENTITYVVRKDGKRSTTSESLDLIYSYLDEKSFFRANRQIIVAISAIDTITKFGNSKLKIQVNPVSEIDIIIGKNKAAAFKQWLDL
ncbi:LytTR family DNA-binding domain-containing protein [Dokdonia sp.]|uniref:LytR/AlgR family response regulator transcription factor n=1 Tax=Dokdonia sp. TaxID=2024995 RepID=UPI003267BE23